MKIIDKLKTTFKNLNTTQKILFCLFILNLFLYSEYEDSFGRWDSETIYPGVCITLLLGIYIFKNKKTD